MIQFQLGNRTLYAFDGFGFLQQQGRLDLTLEALAIKKDYEPALLLPIGFGAVMSNIPLANMAGPDGFLGILFEGINLGIYPLMHNYLMDMKALNMQKRTVAIMEGGSWAPKAGQLMEEFLDGMKQMTVLNEKVTVLSTLNESSEMEMDQMVEAIVEALRDA